MAAIGEAEIQSPLFNEKVITRLLPQRSLHNEQDFPKYKYVTVLIKPALYTHTHTHTHTCIRVALNVSLRGAIVDYDSHWRCELRLAGQLAKA